MNIIQTKDIMKLMKTQDKACITLCLHTQSRVSDKAEIKARFLAMVRDARHQMSLKDIPSLIQDQLENTLKALLNENDIWRSSPESLVIYASESILQVHPLHYEIKDFVHVSSRFLLKYVIPSLFDTPAFHVLFIRNNQVRLYTATDHHLEERNHIQLPQNILDVTEHKGIKSRIQSHSTMSHNSKGQGFFTGAGETLDMVQEDLLRFYHAVDAGVTLMLKESKLPLILVGDENRMHLYRHHSQYPHILTTSLTLENDHDLKGLYTAANTLLHQEEKDEREKNIAFIEANQLKKATKVALRLSDIEYEAYQSNIAKLMVWPDEHVENKMDDDVTETIVREVYLHKGKIYTWNQTAAILRHPTIR